MSVEQYFHEYHYQDGMYRDQPLMYGWEHDLYKESTANVKDTFLNKDQADIHPEAKEIEDQTNIFKSC